VAASACIGDALRCIACFGLLATLVLADGRQITFKREML